MVSDGKDPDGTGTAEPAPLGQVVMNALHVEEVFLPFEAIKAS
jgi:hypothetical protein